MRPSAANVYALEDAEGDLSEPAAESIHIKALFRLYSGSIQALFWLYSGSSKALLRL
jgi:hypothetical protein